MVVWLALGRSLAALDSEAADRGGAWIESFVPGGDSDVSFVPFASVSRSDETLETPAPQRLDDFAHRVPAVEPGCPQLRVRRELVCRLAHKRATPA